MFSVQPPFLYPLLTFGLKSDTLLKTEGGLKNMPRQKRIQITISDENLTRLEYIYSKYGLNKSTQIQSLIAKYLEIEYGQIEMKGESNGNK